MFFLQDASSQAFFSLWEQAVKELEYVLFFSSGIEMKSYFSLAFSGLEVLGVGNRVEWCEEKS